MKCFKGFDKNLKCRDFQYEIGKVYLTDKAELCKEGFHACTNPLDVFVYYNPAESRFCEVELDGIVKGESEDSKQAGTKITIIREIDIIEYTQLCAEYTKAYATNKEDQTKECSSASNSGNRSLASNSGNRSLASTAGPNSQAIVSGSQSLAVAFGPDSKAKGALGNFLTLVEWKDGKIINCRARKIDGKHIKANTFYKMINGKFVEAE